jgi:hypothetical protein
MATAITKRAIKGSALTITEMDTNLQNLVDAVDSKQAALVSGTNIKTVGGNSILGSGDITVGSAALTIVNTAVAYTVTAADLGKIINCTSGIFTVSLTAAATLGSGFTCTIWNTSATVADAITIDPNAAETIDGVATLILRRGEGLDIVCNGTNWQTSYKKTMRGYAENIVSTDLRPVASGRSAIAIGTASNSGSTASGNFSIAIGSNLSGNPAISSGTGSTAIGLDTSASSNYSAAIGDNSGGAGSRAVTGAGAMALGGSYASGTDSFAAGIGNNTSSYGATNSNAIAIGLNANAAASKSVAIGASALATWAGTVAIGGGYLGGAQATYPYAIAIGDATTSAGIGALALGAGSTLASTANGAIALGVYNTNNTVAGKLTLTSCSSAGSGVPAGNLKWGVIVLSQTTTNATPTVLSVGTSAGNDAVSATNQVILPNNSVYGFTGTITAMQQAAGGTDFAIWEIKGGIRRGVNAAATALGTYNINVLSKSSGATAWAIALTADTTNGGLAITATGAAATNIRWVATVNTSEVTYA